MAVFLLGGPVLLALWGAALLFNIFGASDSEAGFYRGRPHWYPLLEGDEPASHRMAGLVMLVIGVTTSLALVLAHTW